MKAELGVLYRWGNGDMRRGNGNVDWRWRNVNLAENQCGIISVNI